MTQTLLTQQINIDVTGNRPFILSLSLRRDGKTHRVELEHNASGFQLRILEAAASQPRQTPKRARKEVLLEIYRDDPGTKVTDAAQRLGLHRNTIHNYLNELEKAGRIQRNGDGVEVLAQ